jgi:hypothetical protein
VTLFDVFSKREADDTGLPKQASDAELLAWSDHIRSLPTDDDDFVVLDLRPVERPPLRRAPLVATPQPPRRVLRARPLMASPLAQLD